ncbi:hypothetical protein BC831DRAFT_274722 [Entophlyctis helioformis]|nr:hypothetical protein BC831DRAFT_274722 [Entophlyctis helioformis]
MLSFLVLLAAVLLACVPTSTPPTRRTLSISSGTVVSREWQPSPGTSAINFNNNVDVVVHAHSSTAVSVFPSSALDSNDDNNDDAVATLPTRAEQEGFSVSRYIATVGPRALGFRSSLCLLSVVCCRSSAVCCSDAVSSDASDDRASVHSACR